MTRTSIAPSSPVPPPPASEPSGHRLVPAERLYWAVLDASALPREPFATPRVRLRRLGYLFEAALPVPIERVHAVYRPLDGGRLLACGMDCDALREEAQGALTLRPASIPPFVPNSVCTAQLNLLSGPFEPAQVRSARGVAFLAAVAIIVVCTGLLALGFERRAGAWKRVAAAADAAEREVLTATLGAAPAGSSQPPSLRLVSELRLLRRTRSTPETIAHPQDVTPILAEVLAPWPADLHARTESLTVSDATVNLTVWLPVQDDAERLIATLRAPDGWAMSQPSFGRAAEGVTLRVRFNRSPTSREQGAPR